MTWRFFLLTALIALSAACALNEGPAPTALPPLTVPAAPTLTLEGDCNVNRDLANWLQFTQYHIGEFTNLVSTAATQGVGEMYDSVQLMGRIRQMVAERAVPDCGEPAQRMVVETMTRAIDGFQSHVNGDNVDLTALVAEVLAQFDQVALIYDELNTRLESQLQEETTSGG